MATRRQPLAFGWLLPGLTAAIVLVVVAMQQPFIVQGLAPGISDVPPFPFSAALTGLIAAVGVGAIAGLIPALVAVRVKPIDAIRF